MRLRKEGYLKGRGAHLSCPTFDPEEVKRARAAELRHGVHFGDR